ncbi:cylicin-1 isoform X2 [Ochotona princeps]|uniref:cylicin-1 isoform X2 n=1 Tax=Ochotona princeps TaxID=9978 RepID=UPI002714D7B6|nr:cylicin-1 isoform X2 [Ochotona princeps]
MSLPRCLGKFNEEHIKMSSSLDRQERSIMKYDIVIPISKSSKKSRNQGHFTFTFPKPTQPGRKERSTPAEPQITVARHDKGKSEEDQKPASKCIRHSLRENFQSPIIYSAVKREAPFRYTNSPKSPPKNVQAKASSNDIKETALEKNFERKMNLYTTNSESVKTMQDEKCKESAKALKSPSKTSLETEQFKELKPKSETNQESKVLRVVSGKDKIDSRKDSKNCKETGTLSICINKNPNKDAKRSSNNGCDVKLDTCSNDSVNVSLLIDLEDFGGKAIDFDIRFKNYSQNNSKKPAKKDAKKPPKKDDKKKDAKKDAESTDAESGDSKDPKKDAKKPTKKDDKKKDAKKDAESTDAESGDSKDPKKDAKKPTKKDDKKKDAKKDAESTDAESGDSKEPKKAAKKPTKKDDKKKDATSTDSESEKDSKKGKKDDKKGKKESKKDGKPKPDVSDSKSTDADSESEGGSKKGKKDDKKKASKKEDKKGAKSTPASTETESETDSKKGKKGSKDKKGSKKEAKQAAKDSESTDIESDVSSTAGLKKAAQAKSSDAESDVSLGKPGAKKISDESDATSVESKKGGGELRRGLRMSSKKTTFKAKEKKATGRVPPSREKPPLPPCEPLQSSPKVKRFCLCKPTPPPPKPRYAPLPEAEWIRKLL